MASHGDELHPVLQPGRVRDRYDRTSVAAMVVRKDQASVISDVAAVIADCRAAAPLAAFYQAACGGEIIRSDEDSVWLTCVPQM